MRAEAQSHVDQINQAVALLRRFFPFRAIAARTRHPDAPHAAPARQEELIAAIRWAIWAAARRVTGASAAATYGSASSRR